ncbi:MAG: hypothetical protein K1X72_05500 [Pyrinomonadaceae bacterium]|nr:hypothetical protein [Pyrinomonadaceae bacterium]
MKKLFVIAIAGLFLMFATSTFGQSKSNQRKTKQNNIHKPSTTNSIHKPGTISNTTIKNSISSSRRGKPKVKHIGGVTDTDSWSNQALMKQKRKRGKRN